MTVDATVEQREASGHMFILMASSCVAVLRQMHLDSRMFRRGKVCWMQLPFPEVLFPPIPSSYVQTATCTFSAGSLGSLFVSFWNILCHNLVLQELVTSRQSRVV